MLVEGPTSLSRTSIRRRLRPGAFPDDGAGADDLDPSPNEDVGDLDEALDSLLAEVRRRRSVCPTGYPFDVVDHSGSPQVVFTLEPERLTYLFLLLLSVSPAFRSRKAWMAAVDRPFDDVVREALLAYLGPSAKALRFGTPRSGSRPGNFAHAIPWLCTQLGLPRGGGSLRKHVGDGGADVVVWRPFAEQDQRMAFVTILAQCTVEMAWHNKGTDLRLGRWKGWVDFALDPVTCLAVPFATPDGYDKWDELRRTTVLVLDRFRIADLCPVPSPSLAPEVCAWIAAEMQKLGADPTAATRVSTQALRASQAPPPAAQ